MLTPTHYGIEQARTQFPAITARAHAGLASVITKHGKPYAAVVPVEALTAPGRQTGVLALRGTGQGLWGPRPDEAVAELRDEWADREPQKAREGQYGQGDHAARVEM
jgi:antitoxin (DNA-binding transcriptional repressor) of toxin-antitoxin stability system